MAVSNSKICFNKAAGVYIFQNTMVGGGGKKNGWLGKKNEIEELGKKNKKGKEKGRTLPILLIYRLT